MSSNLPDGERRRPLRQIGGSGRGLLGRVVEEIGVRVLSGVYHVGQNIPTEPVLMAELNISRTVLREALKILSAKGLLETRPKTGTRVKPRRSWNLLDASLLSLYAQIVDYHNFAQHLQQLRVMIEPEAAALAAINRSEEQLAAIRSAYQAMAHAQDISAWTQADLAFHEGILEATANPFVVPLGSLIHTALETLLFQSASNSPDPFESLDVHRLVLNAIAKRDERAARAAMQVLLANTGIAVSQAIEGASST